MAKHILGRRPANIFCKVNQIATKTTAKVSMPTSPLVVAYHCHTIFLTISLSFPYHSLTKFATRCEGALRRLLVIPYHSHTMSVPFPYNDLATRLPNLEQDRLRTFLSCHACHVCRVCRVCLSVCLPIPLCACFAGGAGLAGVRHHRRDL